MKAIKYINLKDILFLDIETVPKESDYNELSDIQKKHWDKKASFINKNDEEYSSEDLYKQKAGIFSEFSKIVCISVGYVYENNNDKKIRIKSFYSHNEKELLEDFKKLLDEKYSSGDKFLCAHNGKEFDFPFIARRMLVNGIEIPDILDVAGKKPWETNFLDTMELWKFGDYKHFVSLELLADLFNIPTPKDDIDGSEVAKVYYEENDLERIVTYCQKDVITTINIFLKYRGEEIIEPENVEIIK
jgi:predicted PolB exonuclease-like 3'-5' exonuclease